MIQGPLCPEAGAPVAGPTDVVVVGGTDVVVVGAVVVVVLVVVVELVVVTGTVEVGSSEPAALVAGCTATLRGDPVEDPLRAMPTAAPRAATTTTTTKETISLRGSVRTSGAFDTGVGAESMSLLTEGKGLRTRPVRRVTIASSV